MLSEKEQIAIFTFCVTYIKIVILYEVQQSELQHVCCITT